MCKRIGLNKMVIGSNPKPNIGSSNKLWFASNTHNMYTSLYF